MIGSKHCIGHHSVLDFMIAGLFVCAVTSWPFRFVKEYLHQVFFQCCKKKIFMVFFNRQYDFLLYHLLTTTFKKVVFQARSGYFYFLPI